MITIEIDGKTVEIEEGKTVMDAAAKIGTHIPHFCYHKKLSIAANCRMCLVEVEKATKPLPACATPVSQGMKVFTGSELAKNAQKGVMEFLLINHPLDCPICDQGGECQLQDLAVGYGGSESRYTEPKRVVETKELGPLISAAEMSRCIHCTRCVRFGQEIAGIMELGMAGRGEHAEIMSFVNSAVESELSGNMIDVCPVGALTSKPFRYSARTWELARRKTISPHDGLGSNLVAQVKQDSVVRVVPHENESVNECWLSDRDRFSYEGLSADDRLLSPMIKRNDQWVEVGWVEAIEHVRGDLLSLVRQGSTGKIGALASPQATLEELFMLKELMRTLGSENVDYRLRQAAPKPVSVPRTNWLGMSIADVGTLDRFLFVGADLRNEQPLLANRMRKSANLNGAKIIAVNPMKSHLLVKEALEVIVKPSEMKLVLARLVKGAYEQLGMAVPKQVQGVDVDSESKRIVIDLISGERKGVFLGAIALQHPDRANLESLASLLGQLIGAKVGFLSEGANALGAQAISFFPERKGLDMHQMFEQNLDAYVLLHTELTKDTCVPDKAIRAMKQAKTIIALTAYKSDVSDYATVMLPICPFSETSGTYINLEGTIQSFGPVTPPKGDARPGWKLICAVGKLVNADGFPYTSVVDLRESFSGKIESFLKDIRDEFTVDELKGISFESNSGAERLATVPRYSGDAIVRRATALQDAQGCLNGIAFVGRKFADELGVGLDDQIRVQQNDSSVVLNVVLNEDLGPSTIEIPMTSTASKILGGVSGSVKVDRVDTTRSSI